MYSAQEINKKVESFLRSNFNITTNFDSETDLFETRIVDSIGVIELVNYLEKEFTISIPFEDISIAELKNLKAIEDFIIKKTKE